MALLKKLKSLINTTTPTQQDDPIQHTPSDPSLAHLSPISDRIRAWLDGNQWFYHHTPPDDDDSTRTHHIMLGFRDESDFSWNCLIVIHEKSQLVSFYGNVDYPNKIDEAYFLPLFMVFSTINQSLSLGNLEFIAQTGDLRAKIGVDGEFTQLSDRMLGSYMQGLATLTKQAYEVAMMVTMTHTPGDDASSILASMGWEIDETEDEQGFFVPTHTPQ